MVVQLIFADTPICGIVGRDARTEQLAGDWDFTKSLLPPAPLRGSAFSAAMSSNRSSGTLSLKYR
jgi:hypothetical protein